MAMEHGARIVSGEPDPASVTAIAPRNGPSNKKYGGTGTNTTDTDTLRPRKPLVRRSIEDLQNEYLNGNPKPLEILMLAWKGIKELPPDDKNSFFAIAGCHGEPFRGAGWGNSSYWGGYCNHGNVLFPTWHRAYLNRLEEALRAVPGCGNVTLPFWDETSENSLKAGIPWALTNENFKFSNGKVIPNPLRSFVLPRAIVDHVSPSPDYNYSKPKGYETVRYPLSGLVGPKDKKDTEEHNANFPDYEENVQLLNNNVVAWLTKAIHVNKDRIPTNVQEAYKNCLKAPNYTVFSNTTSASQWFDDHDAKVVPLESPHDKMHLALGGFEVPSFSRSPFPGANGDMGENDTASFDPIFFFHHCFIDYVFWLWQKGHDATKKLTIKEKYPGTNTVDSQGPTPGVVPNSWLTLKSPLEPFWNDKVMRYYSSDDVVDIESQLGYTYGPGSLDKMCCPRESEQTLHALPKQTSPASNSEEAEAERNLVVSGINRGAIRGSFVIGAFAKIGAGRHHIGTEAVLSRWHVKGCANCQTHLDTKAVFGIHKSLTDGEEADQINLDQIEVEIHTRDGVHAGGLNSASAIPETQTRDGVDAGVPGLTAALAVAFPHLRVEVR